MADINTSLAIESITEGNSLKVSKDLNANAVGNALFSQLSDQTNSLDLTPIDSAYGATPTALPVSGKYEAIPTTYANGDATPFLTDVNGKLRVEATITGGGSGTSKVDDTAFTVATDSLTPIGGIHRTVADSVDDGDTGAFWMSADRRQYVQPFDGTNAMPMMDAVGRAGYTFVTDGTNTMPTMDVNTRAGFVQPTDGTNDLDYVVINSAYGATPVVSAIAGKYEATPTTYTDGDATPFLTSANGKLQSIVSANDTANGETNPIFVQLVDGALSGIEVVDYDTAAAVVSGATSNHDYTVTVSSTLKVKKCLGSASGAQKIEILSGPVLGLSTQAVQFTSQANQNWFVEFDGLLEIPDTSSGTLRITRTNRENGPAQDLYSTIIGTEI